ncbi:MAG: selenocysteine-specific translation elongation factor [Candidatus Dormibacteria bacterium]
MDGGDQAGGRLPLSDGERRHHVVGTAGHIDHGKSALVRALTGTDPDRLPEERRRGMTIALGFASWVLPSGRRVGVVDVPGHRRFIRTVVAGAQGIDLVLLVVAATEGVMPQTREHLSICELLAVHRAVVVLTKADLADAETLEAARAEIRELMSHTALREAPVVVCSAATGSGLGELAAIVDRTLERLPSRLDRGAPRLFVDRAFSMPGFGPVVTGTLDNGSFQVGQPVELLPGRQRGRIRGLQNHGEAARRADPGMRTAVNLGGVERRSLSRGMAVVAVGTLEATARLDCRLQIAPGAASPLRHRGRAEVLVGTSEVAASIWLLEGSELAAGQAGFAQLHLAAAVAAVPGDRFVLRRAALSATLGGGVVLDVAPRRHRRGEIEVRRALRNRLEGGAAELLLEELRKGRLGIEARLLVARSGMALAQVETTLPSLGKSALSVGSLWFASERWGEMVGAAVTAVSTFQSSQPLRPGLPREELGRRLRLGPHAGPILEALIVRGDLEDRHGALARPGSPAASSSLDQGPVEAALAELARRGLDALSGDELRSAGLTPELQRLLLTEGRIVRLGNGTVLDSGTVDRAQELVAAHLREHGEATVSVLRDLLGATRRVVVPLLERFDATRLTIRAGDVRRLRGGG